MQRHVQALDLSSQSKVALMLASYEETPQKPPGSFDRVTPAPLLASPLASVKMLPSSRRAGTSAAVPSGGVDDTPVLDGGSAISIITETAPEEGMVV